MSKEEKRQNIPTASERRRAEPTENSRKAARRKKLYPDHWQVRLGGFRDRKWYSIWPSRYRGEVARMSYGAIPNRLKTLQEQLDFLAEKYPTTANWPVRFISMAPEEVNRQVLQ